MNVEMASAKQIRKGLYSITWHTSDSGEAASTSSNWSAVMFYGRHCIENRSEIEMVESCNLNYTLDNRGCGQQEVTLFRRQVTIVV